MAALVSTVAIRAGSIARDVSARWAMGRSISAHLQQARRYDYPGWAVLEWECCLKDAQVGAKEGAAFIREHIIKVTDHAFDDFVATAADPAFNRHILGLSEP